jgi:hypothetical protein
MFWCSLWSNAVCILLIYIYSFKSRHSLFYRKPRLITRDDLVIDWRLFHPWAKLIYYNRDKIYGLTTLPRFVKFFLNNSKYQFSILVILNIHWSCVFVVVRHIFLQRQLVKFSMNFVLNSVPLTTDFLWRR